MYLRVLQTVVYLSLCSRRRASSKLRLTVRRLQCVRPTDEWAAVLLLGQLEAADLELVCVHSGIGTMAA